MGLDYIKDPQEIYKRSFETVEREADLSKFSDGMARVATRLIHSCGMTDITEDLVSSGQAIEAGTSSLINGVPIFCDVEMVKAGIIANSLPAGSELICTLNDPRAESFGKNSSNTRTAAGVEFWDQLEGSICVIGNAPTALFRLLERIDEGAGKPALIIGMPVGFIGAAESKFELSENSRGCEFITLLGRRGGSAMASSALNALSFLAKEMD